MQVNIDIGCCAYAELTGFNDRDDLHYDNEWDTKEAVRLVGVDCGYLDRDPDASLILMSYAWDKAPKHAYRYKQYGKKRMDSLLRYIAKHNLGRVTAIPQHVNPNHDSLVKSYVWAISRRNMKAWTSKNVPMPAWHDDRMWRI